MAIFGRNKSSGERHENGAGNGGMSEWDRMAQEAGSWEQQQQMQQQQEKRGWVRDERQISKVIRVYGKGDYSQIGEKETSYSSQEADTAYRNLVDLSREQECAFLSHVQGPLDPDKYGRCQMTSKQMSALIKMDPGSLDILSQYDQMPHTYVEFGSAECVENFHRLYPTPADFEDARQDYLNKMERGYGAGSDKAFYARMSMDAFTKNMYGKQNEYWHALQDAESDAHRYFGMEQ